MMMNLLKKISPNKQSIENLRDQLFAHFTNDPNHSWMKDYSGFQESLYLFLSRMNESQLIFFINNKTYLISCHAKLSCAIGKTGNNQIILMFPEMLNMLEFKEYEHFFAILAHELGHVFFQHTEKRTDPFRAQLEADYFAVSLGLGNELIDILLDNSEIKECRVRINYIKNYLKKIIK